MRPWGGRKEPPGHVCSVVMRKLNHGAILGFSLEDEPQKQTTPLAQGASPNATFAHSPLVGPLKLWELS